MAVRRGPVTGNLTREEYEVVLKALGAYQIRLFDSTKDSRSKNDYASTSTAFVESELVTSAIKKIHRDLEALVKSESSTLQ